MCNICRHILEGFTIEHKEDNCPLRNSQYCAYCAGYGHLTKACKAKPNIMFREPTYLEQLIPYSVLKECNITTKTPIEYSEPKEERKILEIKDNDKVILAYITARSIKIKKGYTRRQVLEEYAKINDMRVVYIQ